MRWPLLLLRRSRYMNKPITRCRTSCSLTPIQAGFASKWCFHSHFIARFQNRSKMTPHFQQQLRPWCHGGPLLKHWLSLITLWPCCLLCVPMVTTCGVSFPQAEAAVIIKLLVSVLLRVRQIFHIPQGTL